LHTAGIALTVLDGEWGRRMHRKMIGLVLVAGLVAGAIATAATGSGAATPPRWSIKHSPSPPGRPSGELSSVSCSSATNCFAVGITDPTDASEGQPLIERWDGTTWSIVASPVLSGVENLELNGVSCASSTSCVAVGDAQVVSSTNFAVNALTLVWRGVGWSVVPSPRPTGGGDVELHSVSCVSSIDCFAVGSSFTVSTAPVTFTSKTVIEHWNGSTWSIVASPDATSVTGLSGVSCSSATSCFAVGASLVKLASATVVEHWDGVKWSIVPSADPSGSGPDVALDAVSCVSDSNCFAVGSTGAATLIEHWDGATWSIVAGPGPTGADGVELNGVSCSDASNCFAVGGTFNSPAGPSGEESFGTLIEHWDGTAWSSVADARDDSATSLAGVACPAPSGCFAVGDAATPLHWDGAAWSIAAFDTTSSQSHLSAVSCARPTDCFAVGSFESGSVEKTLIEHWNGAAWSIVPSPNPTGSFESQLYGVSCPTPVSCIAVGSKATASAQSALIEHWNGSSWSIVAGPVPTGAETAELFGVSCAGSTSCNAVGLNISKRSFAPLAEHWNGKSWSIVATPSVNGSVLTELIAVSCPAPASCMAVGTLTKISISPPGIATNTLFEQWNGTSWSIVTSPAPKSGAAVVLTGVSCPTPANCTAVGSQVSKAGDTASTVVEHWNGARWTPVPTPTLRGSSRSSLVSVSCRSAFSCYAVGGSSTAAAAHSLVEHSNGASWTRVATPPDPEHTTDASLTGVSCPSSASCVAVGNYGANGGSFALAERGT
jgi:hypothetical protein